MPVLLLAEAVPTHPAIQRSIGIAAIRTHTPKAADSEPVDRFVQAAVSATCGNLYKPLIGRLTRYPIPDLPLPPGDGRLLLDLGCNWGRWTIAAATGGYCAVGIDPDLEAILAAVRVARQLRAKAAFVVGDARFLPFGPGVFDTVFSYSVLQHFGKEDVEASLAQVRRVLKVGGTSLIQMANRWGVRSLYCQARRGFREAARFEVRYWSPAQLIAMFEAHLGSTSLSVDGYFGLGIQPSDIDLLPARYRLVVRASELLKRCSKRLPWMISLADSLYLHSMVRPEHDVGG